MLSYAGHVYTAPDDPDDDILINSPSILGPRGNAGKTRVGSPPKLAAQHSQGWPFTMPSCGWGSEPQRGQAPDAASYPQVVL